MIRTGIISFEHMHAWGYAHALQRCEETIFAAFAEEDPERRRTITKEFPAAHAFDSWKAMLEKEPLDAVIVTSANTRHREHAVAAARAGKHVLCEKPISTTLKDARAIIEACRKAGVKLQTAFPVRFCPAVTRAAQLIREGKLGRILAVKTTNHGSMPGGWFVDRKRSGGGAIMDHTVHVVDLLRSMLGEEVTRVYAEQTTRLHPLKVEDCGLLMLRMSGGSFVSLDTSWSRPASYKIWGDVTLSFKGTDANLDVDCFPRLLHTYRNRDMRHQTQTGGDDYDLALVREFAAAIREDRAPLITGEDGLKALEVALGAYRAIRDKRPVALPLK